jgi:hypothetical protein
MRQKRFILAVLMQCVVVAAGVYVYLNAPDRLSLLIYGGILGVVSMGVVIFIAIGER